MRLKRILWIFVTLWVGFGTCLAGTADAAWYNPAWPYRQKITILSSLTTSNLTNFPYLVKITDPTNPVFASAQASGNDILFTAADGSTKLNHEIERFDPTNKVLLAWVQVPSISSTVNTDIYMYYGNGSASNQQNVNGTWDSDFVMVNHLHETGSPQHDSTGYGNDGTPQNGVTQGATGKINGADSFDMNNDQVDVPDSTSLRVVEMTLEAWVYIPTSLPSSGFHGIMNHGSSSNSNWYQLSYNGDANRFHYRWINGSGVRRTDLAAPVSANNWYYVVGVLDTGTNTAYTYLNGSLDTTVTSASLPTASSSTLYFGRALSSEMWKGTIDEVRISRIARTPAWIGASFRNQNTPDTYTSPGPEESPQSISGTVFEDIVGDVLNDGAIGGANNPGAPGVAVYLYRDNGNTVFDGSDTLVAGPVATDASGAYSFTGLTDDTYFVRVDSRTIPSAQDPTAPVGDIWATQTYTTAGGWCANGSGAGVLKGTSGPCYGGITGILSDSSSLPLHYVRVTVSGASVTGIDLGFSFNVVVNTRGGNAADDDAGANRTVQGSLRQFNQNANAISGSNAMRFVPVDPANAGAGSWWRISVSTALPTVTGAGTTIDGTAYQLTDGVTVRNTNTGVLGTGGTVGVDALVLPQVNKPELELAGSAVADGLAVEAANGRIRRLSIWGFSSSAIRIDNPGNTGTVVEENLIGSAPGTLADPGAGSRLQYAVRINDADDGFVRNNVIAFTTQFGVRIQTSGTDRWTVSGNEIRSTGLSLYGGIDVKGADGVFSGNLIVDTGDTGIVLVGSGHVVESNTIINSGQLVSRAGITVIGTSNAVIRRNVITGSSRGGVFVGIIALSGVRISQNHFGGNGANAIDLLEAGAVSPATAEGDGISPNTAVPPNCGVDAGASNQGLDAPVIATASPATVTGTACAGATVEVYRAVADGDASDTDTGTDYGEGVEYLGSAVADGVTGAWSLSGITGLVAGNAVSAITINASNSTSEFGENATVAPGDTCPTVTTTADSGPGSLRQCINYANSNPGTTITFNIPLPANETSAPDSWWRISPASALPPISANGTVIDGSTQTTNQGNTNSLGPEVEIRGFSSFGVNGLKLTSANNTVKGLIINGFSLTLSAGIMITGASATGTTVTGNYLGTDYSGTAPVANDIGVAIEAGARSNTVGGTSVAERNVISGNSTYGAQIKDSGTDLNVVKGNYIGTDPAGTTAVANGTGAIIWISAANNTIGGSAVGEGNLISGNNYNGLIIANSGSDSNVVQGNLIGTDAAGTGNLGNGSSGININQGALNNTIGGTGTREGNTIAFNSGDGIDMNSSGTDGNQVSGNSMFSNTGLGIDLAPNGVTANNGTKNGSLPNSDMDFPVFTSTVLNGSTLTLSGYVGDAPNDTDFANARVEIFKSDNDGSGYGEGQTYLGFVTTDASGNFSGSMTVSGLSAGDRITGTATDVSNNTSEFGGNAVVAAPGTRPDAMIKLASEGAGGYLTDDLYEATASAQVKPLGVVSGSTATYNVLFQNDGNVADDLVITGTGSAPGFTVQYLDNTATDHTGAVTGAGYTIGGLAVGDSTVWTVNVTPAGTVVGGISYDVFVTTVSGTDNTKIDQVQAVTSSTSANLTLLKSADKGAAAPGEDITYSVNVSNGSGFSAADNVVITDPLDTNTGYKIGSASFTAGGSGLTAAVAFSDDPGPVYVYDYTPLVDGGCSAPAGYDYCVTSVKWTTAGSMPTGTSFNVGLVVRVK